MNRTLPFAIIAGAAIVVTGCGNGGFKDDGEPTSFKQAASSANAIAVQVDGNYDKLTPDQKKQFIDMAGGSEGAARRLVQIIAHPPNEVHQGPPGQGGPHATR